MTPAFEKSSIRQSSSLLQADLWGIRLDAISSEMATKHIVLQAQQSRPFAVEYLAVNNLVTAARDANFKSALSRFDLLLADGRPIHWILKYGLKKTLAEHTPAREHMLDLCCAAAREGIPVGLYGSNQHTNDSLFKNLHFLYPDLNICFHQPSVFRELTNIELDRLIDDINSSGLKLLFVGLGCPLQEHFVASIKCRIKAVCLCVGSAFDIHAGVKTPPPKWMKAVGLEWSYRLYLDPARLWKRYLTTNTFFIVMLVVLFLKVGAITIRKTLKGP